MIKAATSLLILIDLQVRLLPVIDGSAAIAANAERLAAAAGLMGVPVVATEQNPRGLGATLDRLASHARHTLTKQHFDATRADGFDALLDAARPQLVIAGCEAHICVLQTALGLIDAGHDVIVVADAVGSRRPENRAAALARLERHGAEIVTTEMVLFEWLGTATHPAFKTVLGLVK